MSLVKDHEVGSGVNIEDIYDGVPAAGDDSGCVKLGEGVTANVYKIQHKKTGTEYALKVIKLMRVTDPEKREMLLREIPVLKTLDHPGIIKIVEVFRMMNTIYIVMELCSGGELFDYALDQPASKFSEQRAQSLAKKMLGSLRYIHSKNIAHRDLKLENFIMTSKDADAGIKLIDFGFSRQYLEANSSTGELVGTPYYIAPEVLAQKYAGSSSDMWSFGVVIFMLVTGEPPFWGDTNAQIMDDVKAKAAKPKEMRKQLESELASVPVSKQCSDFIMQCLVPNPRKRLNSENALKHEWIKSTKQFPAQAFKSRPIGIPKALANLKEFKDRSSLQRSAMMAVAFGASQQSLDDLNAAFLEMDINGDGKISLSEFTTGMKAQGMTKKEEIEAAFEAIDQDGTGAIEYSEFIAAAMSEQELHSADQLEAAFYRLDMDSSGSISKEELKELLGGKFDDGTIQQVLDAADLDNDGEISLAEFKTALSGAGGFEVDESSTGSSRTVRRASWVSEKPVWAVVWSNGAWRLKEVTQSAPLDDGNDHC